MKFKIGQKVRIVEWKDMPEDLQDIFGINTYGIGLIGVVDKFERAQKGVNGYNIKLKGGNHFALEPELEPLVRVGEQLMLFEI